MRSAGFVTDRPSATTGRPQVLPLSPERYRVTFTASAELQEKLELARVLMRSGRDDLAAIVERAIDLLIEVLEREKRGKAKRPRKSKGTADPSDVTRETRRAVYERDASQCAFVNAEGERCPAREFLELDHRHPRALGGTGQTENIRLLCRAHNEFVAEQAFGREHMEAKRRRAPRQGSKGAPAADLLEPRSADRHVRSDANTGPVADAPSGPSRHSCDEEIVATHPHQRGRDGVPPGVRAGVSRSEPVTLARHPHQRGRTGSGVDGATTIGHDQDRRPPREVVRTGLIKLGFASRETDRALDELPAGVWSEPLEAILRHALARLT